MDGRLSAPKSYVAFGTFAGIDPKVVKGLDSLDSNGRREIIRTVVRQIEIDQDNVEVIFRVPPKGRSPEPGPINMPRALQHCTDVRRTHFRLA
jgi:site-specific DNA recombinase